MNAKRIATWVAAGATVLALTAWAFWPAAVQVDLVIAKVAPMQVSVAAEGVARVREPYAVTAPLAGAVTRSPVQVGDKVVAGQTVIAVIEPAEPAILDARSRLQAEAAVTEAEAGLRVAEAKLSQSIADVTHAQAAFARSTALADQGLIPLGMLEDVASAKESAFAAQAAAQSAVEMQRATVDRMKVQLQGPLDLRGNDTAGGCCYEVKSPLSGTVLAVENLSARPVQAGAALLTIGDLADMEIEVDLLSTDAVQVAPGAPAQVERWGGDGVIDAVVRRVDPSAYTKVSALGIEEQRVKLRLDIVTPPEARTGLGDNFRVFVRVVIWDGGSVLQVPLGALFREDGKWALFRAVNGRATKAFVEIGRQTDLEAQILSGLGDGDQIVVFPGNKVEEGTRLTARAGG